MVQYLHVEDVTESCSCPYTLKNENAADDQRVGANMPLHCCFFRLNPGRV